MHMLQDNVYYYYYIVIFRIYFRQINYYRIFISSLYTVDALALLYSTFRASRVDNDGERKLRITHKFRMLSIVAMLHLITQSFRASRT